MNPRLARPPVPASIQAPSAGAGTRDVRGGRLLAAAVALSTAFFTSGAAYAQEAPTAAPPTTETPTAAPPTTETPTAAPPTTETPPTSTAPAAPLPPSGDPPPTAYPSPPPPQDFGAYPPVYYPAVQQERSPYRPFMLGLGLGVGTLSFRDPSFGTRVNDPGLSYTLRIGFGITGRWLAFLGAEGTGVNHVNAGFWQTAYLLGAQWFVLKHLYLRAGFGLARATAQGPNDMLGEALMAGAGFEFAQGDSTSLAFELSFTGARYPGERWGNGGLNFVLSFF